MSTPFIAPLSAVGEFSGATPLDVSRPVWQAAGAGGVAVTPSAFGQLVTHGIEQVDTQLKASQVDLQALASGQVGDLHNVMIKLEESRLAFQLMLQVRNRLLESYQEVMRMQV